MEIIAGVILTQPLISQVAGILLRKDKIPGFRTIFGLVVITCATLATSYGARFKATEEVKKLCKDDLKGEISLK